MQISTCLGPSSLQRAPECASNVLFCYYILYYISCHSALLHVAVFCMKKYTNMLVLNNILFIMRGAYLKHDWWLSYSTVGIHQSKRLRDAVLKRMCLILYSMNQFLHSF